ncbi:hypothetical protein C3B51_17195 [Pseudoalteromonas rubra]|uniref:Uncharacterized protein n=1 Tax=Pseudoalteromonas rubra TaxID=43658 RepID=A0A4Q7E4R5_9GAMM|nr:hypothetical protein [Pseudoalteromonas rubra]RZM77117.1 hypothetical protein C3B51_17195 [Pseudoalteromonas rubra]
MRKIVSDEALLKGLLQSLAYYMFIASLLKLMLTNTPPEAFTERLMILISFGLLSFLALIYSMVHVLGPIVKSYHPEFEIPFTEKGNQQPIPITKLHLFPGMPTWILLVLANFLVGAYIMGLGFL